MVEQWSSKSPMWVRILLPLFLKTDGFFYDFNENVSNAESCLLFNEWFTRIRQSATVRRARATGRLFRFFTSSRAFKAAPSSRNNPIRAITLRTLRDLHNRVYEKREGGVANLFLCSNELLLITAATADVQTLVDFLANLQQTLFNKNNSKFCARYVLPQAARPHATLDLTALCTAYNATALAPQSIFFYKRLLMRFFRRARSFFQSGMASTPVFYFSHEEFVDAFVIRLARDSACLVAGEAARVKSRRIDRFDIRASFLGGDFALFKQYGNADSIFEVRCSSRQLSRDRLIGRPCEIGKACALAIPARSVGGVVAKFSALLQYYRAEVSLRTLTDTVFLKFINGRLLFSETNPPYAGFSPIDKHFFYLALVRGLVTNVAPAASFRYALKKKILKIFNASKFSSAAIV